MSVNMKRNLLFILICIFIFLSVIAQVSDQFIIWLNPSTVSIWDERMWFTLVPVLVNFLFLGLLSNVSTKDFVNNFCMMVNSILVLYYVYWQFIWDVGDWMLF